MQLLPFGIDVNVDTLKLANKVFSQAVSSNLIEGTLYRWAVDVTAGDSYQTVTIGGTLNPWEGYWLKTKESKLTLTIPAPTGLSGFTSPLPASFNPPGAGAPSASVVQANTQATCSVRLSLEIYNRSLDVGNSSYLSAVAFLNKPNPSHSIYII